MTTYTALEVYTALVTVSLPPSLVDAVNQRIYFPATVSAASVHAVIDPLGWTGASILVLGTTDEDPYPQYLDITRHDSLLRHVLGTVVPRDSSKVNTSAVSTDGTFTADSDALIPTQKASKTYADTKIAKTAIDTDSTFEANSDEKLASQKATKAYVSKTARAYAIIFGV